MPGPIGIFDSGYGGLTVFDKIRERMPAYDYIYLGDNARAPYGPRSFDVVYRFTRQAVMLWDETRRVLGVIRPTVELMDRISRSKHVGVVGTAGTIASGSYQIEIAKMFPHIQVTSEACPMWVPLVENNEFDSPGADYFVRKYLDELFRKDPLIDTLILGCTHYPLLIEKIRRYVPTGVTLLPQGEYVACSLEDYLHRHPEMDCKLTKGGTCRFLTTESAEKFSEAASVFLSRPIRVEQVVID